MKTSKSRFLYLSRVTITNNVINNVKNGLLLVITLMLALFTVSCSDDVDEDIKSPSAEDPTIVNPKSSLDDAFNVSLKSKTYVYPGDFDNTGKSIVKRVQNSAGAIDQDVETVIMHNSNASRLTDADAESLTSLVARGGGVVICEPTRRGIDALVRKIQKTIPVLLKNNVDIPTTFEGLANCRSIYNMDADDSGLIVPTFLSSTGGADDVIGDLVAIKGRKKYIVGKHDGEKKITTEITEEGDEDTAPTTKAGQDMVVDAEASDYILGLHADALATWLDTPDDAEARLAKGRTLLKENSASNDESTLLNLANSQQVTHSYTELVSTGREVKIDVQYFIWAVRDVEEGSDYYMVHQEIKSYNSLLNCGPSDAEDKWYSGDDVDKAFSDVNHNFKENIPHRLGAYWLYMTRFLTKAEFCQLNNGEQLSISNVSPATNMTGTTRYETSLTTNVKYGITVSKSPGVKYTRGVTINETWSYDRPDLDYTFTYGGSNNTNPQWNYAASQLPYAKDKGPRSRYKICHIDAAKVLTTDLTLGHSWIWKVYKAEKAYSFNSRVEIDLGGLWHGWKHTWKGDVATYGSKAFKYDNEITINLDRPARYEQNWIMEMVPENFKTQLYMKQYFSDVWMPSFIVNTVEEDDYTLVDKQINDVINRLKVKQDQLDSAKIESFTLKWAPANSSATYRQYTHEAKWK